MIELLGRRRLEAEDLGGLRIEAAHDVLDRAVLAGGVHRLEDQQQRPAVLRVEDLGQIEEALGRLLQQPLGFLLGLERRGVGRIVLGQPHAVLAA